MTQEKDMKNILDIIAFVKVHEKSICSKLNSVKMAVTVKLRIPCKNGRMPSFSGPQYHCTILSYLNRILESFILLIPLYKAGHIHVSAHRTLLY